MRFFNIFETEQTKKKKLDKAFFEIQDKVINAVNKAEQAGWDNESCLAVWDAILIKTKDGKFDYVTLVREENDRERMRYFLILLQNLASAGFKVRHELFEFKTVFYNTTDKVLQKEYIETLYILLNKNSISEKEMYANFLDLKQEVLNYIATFSLDAAQLALEKILSQQGSLGQFFWQKRGLFAPDPDREDSILWKAKILLQNIKDRETKISKAGSIQEFEEEKGEKEEVSFLHR